MAKAFSVVVNLFSANHRTLKLNVFLAVSGMVLLVLGVCGDFFWGLMDNARCFRYLGCNIGFFGYDSLVHFFGGIFMAAAVVWLFRFFPVLDLFHDGTKKNIVILIALVAFLSGSWEVVEFSYDHVRTDIMHIDLYHPDQLAQPSNPDTMGDLFFDIIGTAAAAFLLDAIDKKSLTRKFLALPNGNGNGKVENSPAINRVI